MRRRKIDKQGETFRTSLAVSGPAMHLVQSSKFTQRNFAYRCEATRMVEQCDKAPSGTTAKAEMGWYGICPCHGRGPERGRNTMGRAGTLAITIRANKSSFRETICNDSL
jgi:hypothetical protein